MATMYATGKRKAAIAKVWLTPGNGEMLINGKTLDQWLGGHETLKMKVRLPLEATKQLESMNIRATTLGGGYAAQADALKHGITKALVEYEPSFRAILKPMGLLTRDSRVVERKKPGKKKARIFPIYSDSIESIEVLRRGRVRRAKLFYLRELKGKAARIKELRRK